MSAKPQELSLVNQFEPEVKQPNRTKKVILLNNGLLANDHRGNNDQTEPFNLRSFDTNVKGRLQIGESSLIQRPAPVSNDVPQFDRKLNYNKLFWKMYVENELVVSEMRQCITNSKEVQARISALEHECQELEKTLLSNSKKETKKKNRRTADEIQKTFLCPYRNCNKNYGSDVSLNLHIKLKHNGGNKTEREKLARTIFLAKMKGEEVPEINLNLPPGFLENMNKSKLLRDKANKKERSATKDKETEIEGDGMNLGKGEGSRPLMSEENREKQSINDSHSVETNSETPQKQSDFQDFSTKAANLLPSLITTKSQRLAEARPILL